MLLPTHVCEKGATNVSWIPFVASVHGWPFANFKSGHGLPFDIFANCGGMCHTALDRYYRRKPVDRSATAPDGSALRSEIERRQTDSIFPGIWLKTVSWASKGATGMQTDHLQHSTGHLTQSEEWPDIKNKLDSQEPTVICLVRGADPTDAHQVVATGYHAHDGNRVTMSVYDPNHPDEDDWIVQFFLGRPESQLLASQFRQSTRATEAELKGFFRVDYDRKVNLHVHQFDEAGLVGNRVDQRTWTAGWDNVNTYQIGQKTFLFLLKSLSGVVNIHEMNPDGSVGESIQTADWTSGWTTVTFYRVGDETYLFILKAHGMGSDGCNVHVNRINADGTIGDKVFAATWSDGWTDAVAFTTGGNAFLLILEEGKRRHEDSAVAARWCCGIAGRRGEGLELWLDDRTHVHDRDDQLPATDEETRRRLRRRKHAHLSLQFGWHDWRASRLALLDGGLDGGIRVLRGWSSEAVPTQERRRQGRSA